MKNILLVDDCPSDQFLNYNFIDVHFENVHIDQAYNGREALDFINKQHRAPDLILLDINMPIMNGHQFLQAYSNLKIQEPSVIIVLSSSSLKEDQDRIKNFSFVADYMIKPLKPQNLEKFLLPVEPTKK